MTSSGDCRGPALRIVGAVFVLVVLAGGQDDVRRDSVTFDETFDPGMLKEPPIEWPVILQPGETLPEEGEDVAADSTGEGYRIQVMSTPDYATADSLMRELMPIFDQEVYLVFDPPNYKVRVGNFRFRSSAEEAQSRLEKMGFRSAWIIRTEIVTHPDAGAP